jgi:lipoyl(octanoyl) transferase
MDPGLLNSNGTPSIAAALRVYLLGAVDFETALAVQRSLVYDVAGDRHAAALVLCEHPSLVTIGREGSPSHLRCDPEELRAQRWRVRWVNRGGGCFLHLPGQMAVYPILALDRRGLGVKRYVEQLQRVVVAVLDDFGIRAATRPGQPGVWVGPRMIAAVGVAVRDWVSYFGLVLNVNPDLVPFRLVRNGGLDDGPMTSLERERRGPLRPALVRERLLEHFCATFPFDRTALFFSHPLLTRPSVPEGVTASS